MAPAKSEIDPSRYVHDTASVASVYAEQIRLLYQSDKLAPLNVLIAGLATAMFWSIFPAWIFGLWFGSFCVVISGRVVLHYYYGQASDCSANALGWAHRYVGGAAATGVLWGLCGSIILATSDTSYHVLSLFLIGGMMAGSMLAHSAYLPAFYGFTLPAALPALVILLTRADPRAIEMGLMLAGYIVVFAITGRNINRSIVENLRLRIEQDVILAQLRMSEAALAEAQAIACIGSWHYDALLQTISWSEETFHICGVDPGAFRPSREAFLARIHPDDRAMYDKNHCEAIAGGAPLEIDVRVVMDDGAVKDVHVSGRNFYDAAGQFTHSIGTVQDVTERKIAETRLQFANILLKAEMEASPDGILVVGPTE
jgi:PAS domain-containing protein